ncbi:MAG: hypothetical protein WB392_02260 [Methanotrichaceae archaeon]
MALAAPIFGQQTGAVQPSTPTPYNPVQPGVGTDPNTPTPTPNPYPTPNPAPSSVCTSGCNYKIYQTEKLIGSNVFEIAVTWIPLAEPARKTWCIVTNTLYELSEIWFHEDVTEESCVSCTWCDKTHTCSCTPSELYLRSFYISNVNTFYWVTGNTYCCPNLPDFGPELKWVCPIDNVDPNNVLRIQSSTQALINNSNKNPLGPTAYGHINNSSVLKFTTTIGKNTSAALFLLAWTKAESNLTLEVYSPSGEKIKPRSTLSVYYGKNKTFELYIIRTPDPGNWNTRVIAKDLHNDGENYYVYFNSTGFVDPFAKIDRSKAKLNGLISSYGTDVNHDKLIDYVTATIGIDVYVPGTYYVKGILCDANNSNDRYIGNGTFLNFGSKKISINIFNLNASKQYYIKDLELYDEKGNMLDYSERKNKLAIYRNIGHSLPPARLANSYKDYEADVDINGLFEYLRIDIGVNVSIPGNYSLMGDLYDTNGTEVVWSTDYKHLDPGNHIMHLDFDGRQLVKRKVNGPYYLKNLILLIGSSTEGMTPIDEAINAYKIPYYSYTDFSKGI